MSTNIDNSLPSAALQFLQKCYKFLHQDWPRAIREPLPDHGFEERLRERCVIDLIDWRVSPPWELHLGSSYETSSGTKHEIDLVAEHTHAFAILEAKNRPYDLPTKNDVIVFFAKILDYLTCNPSLALKDICPVFISTCGFEQSGLAACLGLGIHPIGPSLRPLPILNENVRLMENELRNGLVIDSQYQDGFMEFRANVVHCSLLLEPTWFSNRYGYQSEDTIVSKAVRGLSTLQMSDEFRELNGQCSQLIEAFSLAKAKRSS